MPRRRRSMAPRQFRIGELAAALELEHYVIRFWEREFKLSPSRSAGNQRFYTNEDLATFMVIKDLLYSRGYTISGAKQQMATRKAQAHSAATPTLKIAPARTISDRPCKSCEQTDALRAEITALREQLSAVEKIRSNKEVTI